MVLDVADPDPAMVAAVDQMLGVYGVKPFGVIDAEGFNTALAENPDLFVIDVRTQSEVDEKGSIDTGDVAQVHIPLEEFVAQQDQWPEDLDASVVIYCGSGHRSTMALTILGTYGYSDVKSLKGGFGGWADAGYPVVGGVTIEDKLDEAYSAMLETMEAYNTIKADGLVEAMTEDTPPFLLDVRTTEEVAEQGHIEGAVNIPLNELTQNINLLPDFDTPIVAYCGSGWRATIAMTALNAMGWTDVKALKTTFVDWVEAGNPVVEGPASEAMVLDVASPDPAVVTRIDEVLSVYGVKPYGVIDAEGLNTALAENPELIVIDVRTLAEMDEKGVIDTGDAALITIPLEEFISNQDMWPEDMDASIAVYCGSGHRSTMAMEILWSYGYTDVSSLKGGFGGWVEAGFPIAEYVAQ
jgi:rhodanese-related sulfurtransferase